MVILVRKSFLVSKMYRKSGESEKLLIIIVFLGRFMFEIIEVGA